MDPEPSQNFYLLYTLSFLGCLILSAFFSASETSLLRIAPDQIDADLKKKPSPSVSAAKDLVGSSSRILVTILIGNNIVNVLMASLMSLLAIRFFGEGAGLAIGTGVTTALILVFGEIVPKTIAAKDPRSIAYLAALPLYILHKILTPVHFLFEKGLNPLLKKLFGEQKTDQLASAERILRLAKEMKGEKGASGPIPIISSVAKAAELHASDIMIPRAEVFSFSLNKDPSEMLKEMIEERYTRVPIYRENLDDAVGFVHFKDLMHLVHHKEESITIQIESIIKPALRVPERKPILAILSDMQKSLTHLALVKDEFGGTTGILSQEDILEEIVGEIRDEFDRDELLEIRKVPGEHAYEAVGSALVHDFNRETGWHIHAERGDTLGGLFFNKLGRTPKIRDSVQIGPYHLSVLYLSGHRIARLRVHKDDGEAKPKTETLPPEKL